MNLQRQLERHLPRVTALVVVVSVLLGFALSAHAQTDIYKTNNNTNSLSSNTAWTNSTGGAGGNPAAVNGTEIGVIDSTLASGNASLTTSATITIAGLKILNPGAALTLNGTGAIQTLNIGEYGIANGGGIDMSNSTVGLSIGSNIAIVLQGQSQTWTIGNATIHPILSVAGTVNTNGQGLAIAGNGTSVTFSGAISGNGAFYQEGTNTTTLSGNNTMTGVVNLISGTLVLTNNGSATNSSLGTGTFAISGGNLNTGASAVTFATNNNLILYGGFTFVGSNNMNMGTGNTFLANDATITLTGNTLTLNNVTDGYNGTSNAWTSGRSITEAGGGTLALNGTGWFSGNLNLTAGTLSLLTNTSMQNATLNYTGGTLNFNSLTNSTFGGLAGNQNITLPSSFALTLNTNPLDVNVYTGNISGTSATLTINGSGTEVLSGNSTFTGGVTLAGGTLAINSTGNATAGPIGTGAFTITGGNLDNTSGSSLTLATNNTVSLNGNFTYLGSNGTALNMGTGAVTMNASHTITVANSALTLGGVVSGTGFSLTKNGAGQLTLTGANTYTGGTTINGGTLLLSGSDTAATGTTTLNSNAELILNNNAALGGALVINGGTLDSATNAVSSVNYTQAWNGDFTYAGTGTYSMGTGAVTMNASRTVTVNASTLTVGGVISGASFSLTKAGAGTLVLTGNDTYSGGTIISNGTLVLSGNNSGAGNTSLNTHGTLDVNNGGNATTSALGTGQLVINGGTLDNTSGANVTLATNNAEHWEGNFTYLGTGNLNTGTGLVTLGEAGSSPIVTVAANTLTVGGTITGGSFNITKAGAGTLYLTNASSNFTGGIVIDAGTLAVNNMTAGGTVSSIGNASTSAANLIINGGTLQVLAATAQSTDRLIQVGENGATIDSSGANTITFNGTSGITYTNSSVPTTLTFTGTNTGANTFTPIIVDAAGSVSSAASSGAWTTVIKNGTGEWELNSASSNYSGGTILNAGTLIIGSGGNATASSIGTGMLTINGGTLNVLAGTTTLGTNNTQTWNNSWTFAGTGNLNIGTGNVSMNSSLTLTVTGNTLTIGGSIYDQGSGYSLTKAGAGTLVLNGVSNFSGNMNLSAGTLTLGAAGALQFATLDYTGGTLGLFTGTNNLGGLAGTSAINLGTNNITLGVNYGTTDTYSGALSGSGNVVKNGGGTEVLSGANTFTGNTSVTAGTLVLSGLRTSNGTTTLSGGTLAINVNGTATTGALGNVSTLTITGGNLDNTSGGNIVVAGNYAENWNGNFTYIGSSNLSVGTGAVTMNASRTVTVNANTLTVGGVISGTGFSLTKDGAGTLVLTGLNSYTGGTILKGGTLTTDYSTLAANTSNILSNNSTITFNGGTWNVLGNTTATSTNTQNLTATTINTGAATIVATAATGNTVINLGNITRSAGGTLDATKSVGTTSKITGNTTSTTTLNGVITSGNVAYLTFNGQNWANITTGNLTNATTSANLVQTSWATTSNVLLTGNSQTISANRTVNTLTFNGGTATETLSGFVLTVNTGGILLSSNATGAVTFTGGNITGGNYAGSELVFAQFNTSNAMTVNSAIINANTTNTTAVTKTGGGNLILGGTNTYSNKTYLDAGTITIGSATALGSGQLVITGGNLDANSSITLTNNNTQQWNHDFGFTGSNNLNMGTGAVTLNGNVIITDAASTLTVGGVISGSGFSLTKNGAGTLAFTGNNTYTGGTTVNAGTLILSGNSTTSGNTTLNGGTLVLNNGGNATASALGTGTLVINGGTLDNTSGANVTLATNNAINLNNSFTFTGTGNLNVGTGAVSLNSDATATVTANTLTIGGVISGTPNERFTKAGTGTLVLSGISTYAGGTNVTGGILEASGNFALGAAGSNITVSSGATLQLDGGFDSTGSGSSVGSLLTISGTGTASQGALVSGVNGTGDWQGNIALAANASIGSGTGTASTFIIGNANNPLTSTVSLGSNTLTFVGSGTTEVTANITGTGNVNVNTSGTVQYIMNGNGYTGTTTITNGTLLVDTTASSVPLTTSSGNLLAINGPIVIGDGVGGSNTAILQMGATVADNARYTISANASVTINPDGEFFVNGQTQQIGSLTMNGGDINTTNTNGGTTYGLLILNGNASVLANANSAVINGNFEMVNSVGNATSNFTVASGGNTSGDLIMNALLSGGSMIKSGSGNMVLANGSNSFTGTVEVQAGTLNIQAAGALGAANNQSNEGTTVDSGGQLQVQGSLAIANEQLTLNGNGTGTSDGALQSVSGNNSWSGNVIANTNATVNTTAGSLQFSGNVNTGSNASNAATLTFNGNGNTTLSGNVSGALSIVKNGSGTLLFNSTSDNSFTGNTTINAGTVELNSSTGNVAISGSTLTVNSGGTLLSDVSNNLGNGVNMVLNGGTWQTNGSSGATWSETLNTLTLSATSNLTLGSNSNVVNYADSHSTAWQGDSILYVNNWNGSLQGSGTDQVYFGNSAGGLGGTSYTGQLGEIIFVDPTIDGVATSSDYHAIILSTGEIVPFVATPEPGTVAAGAGLGALVLLREWRRRKQLVVAKN